jgi:hypothetical protein
MNPFKGLCLCVWSLQWIKVIGNTPKLMGSNDFVWTKEKKNLSPTLHQQTIAVSEVDVADVTGVVEGEKELSCSLWGAFCGKP